MFRIFWDNNQLLPEQQGVHVVHHDHTQNEATLINFRIYQNDPIFFMHCADFCLKGFECLNQVRGNNFGK